MMAERRICVVSGPDCEAPAGWGIGGGGGFAVNEAIGTRATCFGCGEPVCTACSTIRSWWDYGPRRICTECSATQDRFDAMKSERTARSLAGVS